MPYLRPRWATYRDGGGRRYLRLRYYYYAIRYHIRYAYAAAMSFSPPYIAVKASAIIYADILYTYYAADAAIVAMIRYVDIIDYDTTPLLFMLAIR